jgi:NAD(P)-dependent dehydrogenase (short-subunit alcohol dehydrogenase family)
VDLSAKRNHEFDQQVEIGDLQQNCPLKLISALPALRSGLRVIGINLRGVWSCMKHALRQMQRQGSDAIVNNASVGAMTGHPGVASYIASKHGIVG